MKREEPGETVYQPGTREEVGSKKSGMVAEFSDLVLHFDAFACVGEQDLNEPQILAGSSKSGL